MYRKKNQQLDWYIILYYIINSVMHSMNIFYETLLYKQTPYCAPI